MFLEERHRKKPPTISTSKMIDQSISAHIQTLSPGGLPGSRALQCFEGGARNIWLTNPPKSAHYLDDARQLSRELLPIRIGEQLLVANRALSVEDASGVYDDRLTSHRIAPAHRHHHLGAIVLVGGLLQE